MKEIVECTKRFRPHILSSVNIRVVHCQVSSFHCALQVMWCIKSGRSFLLDHQISRMNSDIHYQILHVYREV